MSRPAFEVGPEDLDEDGRWTVRYRNLKGLAVGHMLTISTPSELELTATVVDHNADGLPIVEVWDEPT